MRLTKVASCIAVVGAIAGAGAGFAAPAAAAALYSERFPFNGGTQDQALRNEGWCGGNGGDPFCNNPVGGPGDNQGGEGAISAGGTGPDGEIGFAFWSQKGTNADSFLYTDEFSFNTSINPVVSWFQRDSAAGDATDPARVALKIGSDWYVSGETFSHVGANADDWQAQSATLADLTYFTIAQSGNLLPDIDTTRDGIPTAFAALPADATVDAFGFWWGDDKVATSRFDDVHVTPIPGAAVLFASGVAALGYARRRRRAA